MVITIIEAYPPVVTAQRREPGAKPLERAASALYGSSMTLITNVYIDGFNLYYGAVRGTPYKWLNLAELCRIMLPQNQIKSIKYFTARVEPRPHDPGQATRQQTYIRALRTIPNLMI